MNHETVEKLYDLIDDMAMLLVEHANMKYVDALVAVGENVVRQDVLQELETEIEIQVYNGVKSLNNQTFEKEEVRKALQLVLLKGMKADSIPMDTMTPDSIGLIVGYLIGLLNQKIDDLSLADFTVGTGNLLTSVLNGLTDVPAQIYGVDDDYQLLALAKMMADMQDYEVQFFHQSSARAMAVAPVDVIIGDLPAGGTVQAADIHSELAKAGCDDLGYLLIENHLNHLAEGGFGIYVINNDFFSKFHIGEFHQMLTARAEIGMLLQLPTKLFKDASKAKSIFVIKKVEKGHNQSLRIHVNQFPDLSDREGFQLMLTNLQKWITINKWARN